ncbi:MAG: hypothetical protein ACLP01_13415 [Solirubrobacteraceae bacterium]
MLDQLYRLASAVAVGGTTPLSTTVGFGYDKIGSQVFYTMEFNPGYSVLQSLTITQLPPQSSDPRVELVCHGGGCPLV